ncbi:hypothetical protein FPOAC2_06186 [Fusarium poae]|uniref:hypothetical protein n=1 Tax=Fusarium poae TaxID=36050 RepID=UPI001CE81DAD|nr:hypothetical protein FPOAC1_006069 [Fusarium poae]KAG8672781.1 hypothetical protein FPOAC1_006069 [Fusarium poae]
MNSTGTNIDDVEILDLTADTDDESNQPLLPPIPVTNSDSNSNSNSNSLPRRYRQGGATFTANPQGCFERTRKRRRSDHLRNGRKQARLESTRKSIHYDAVYQNQRAVKKHIIVRRPTDLSQHAKYYIIRCEEHDIGFDDNPLQDALKHLRAKHGILTASHDTVIDRLGIEVVECDDQKLEQNNAITRKALENGNNALGRHSIRVKDDSGRSELPLPKRICPEFPTPKQNRNQRPTLPRQRHSQHENEDISLNLVPGNVYIIWWFETKQWFAGLLMPPHNLESVGIHKPLETLAIFKTLPACYQYDTSSKSLSWAEGYEEGGPKFSERYYPFIFFEGFKFPEKCHQAWIQIDKILPWDDDKAAYIVQKDQAIRFVRKQREQRKLGRRRTEAESEKQDSMDGACRDSDRDENSDVYEFGPSSPSAEPSTDEQAVPETNIATPDTINEPEVAADLKQISKRTAVHPARNTEPLEQSDESDLEMIDAHDDMEDSPAPESSGTTAPLPEFSAQQERARKGQNVDPEQITQTPDSPIQFDDEMDLGSIGDMAEPEQEKDDTLEGSQVITTAGEVLHTEEDKAQKDTLMTEPRSDHSTTKEPSGTIVEVRDDLTEEMPPADTTGTDIQSITESEDDAASQQPKLATQSDVSYWTESNEKTQSTSARQDDRNRWTTEDMRRIIDGTSSERGTVERASSEIQSTTETTPVQQLAVVKGSASAQLPIPDIDLDSLLQEGESLELHMSQSERAAQQPAYCQPSPTSSDDNSLAHEIFNVLISEDLQPSIPTSLPRMNHSNNDTFRPRVPFAGLGGRYPASSPRTSEEHSQPSPYAQMGEPASVHSRPVSKGSDVRQSSYETTGTPASAMRRLSAISNAKRRCSNSEMGHSAPVPATPLTEDDNIPQVTESTTEGSKHESNLQYSTDGSMDEITSAQPRLSSQEHKQQSPATETSIRQNPVTSHHETCPTAETAPVQMPFRSAATHQTPSENPGDCLQQVIMPPIESHVEVSQSTIMPFGIQATAPPQQSANVSVQGHGATASPDMPPIAELDSSQSISTSDQYERPADSSSHQPPITDRQSNSVTESYHLSQSPSAAQQLASAAQQSAREVLRFLEAAESPFRQPGYDAQLPPPGGNLGPDASSPQLGQQGHSAIFKTPTVGNSHAFQEAMPSPRQPNMQSPQVSHSNTAALQAIPSPNPSNPSISRSSSLSQGYTLPPPKPLPSTYELAGEAPRAVSNTQDLGAHPSPHQPTRELPRSHAMTYGQPRPYTAASSPHTTTSLPPPGTLAQGLPSLQVNASPRLQVMEISPPNSTVHESRAPTSPRQYAMRVSQPGSTVHRAPVNTASSPRIPLVGISRPGSFVQGQPLSASASPQLTAREVSQSSSGTLWQRTQPSMSSPQQTSIAMSQSAPPAREHIHQPPLRPSPRLPALQPVSTAPLSPTVVPPHFAGANIPHPLTAQGQTSLAISSRSGPPTEPCKPGSREHNSDPSNGPLPPPHLRRGNYVPATATQQSHSSSSQTHFDYNTQSHRHSHTASQLYSYGNSTKPPNSTPRSHAPAYQVPVQPPNPVLHPAPLHTYLPQHIAKALIERTGVRKGNDLQPGDFLNSMNMYQCPFCRAGMPEQAVFVQHLQRLCPYAQKLDQAGKETGIRR